jgi:hypothetical protein
MPDDSDRCESTVACGGRSIRCAPPPHEHGQHRGDWDGVVVVECAADALMAIFGLRRTGDERKCSF